MSDQEAEQSPPQNNQDSHSVQLKRQQVTFSGPLPPPAILEHYDQVVPGAAERIITMTEQQSKHRQTLESKVVASDVFNSKLGLIFGFILGIVAIGGGILLTLQGQPIYGTIFGGLYLIGIVGVFVYGSQQRRKERQSRSEERGE